MRVFKQEEAFPPRRSLLFLNISQFLGVVNDNAFKLLIVFLFIGLKGPEHSSVILFWAGTIYVLPFLLFSSAAGVLADRFSKQRMIVFLKGTEIVVVALGIPAFAFESQWASYLLLFLLSFQSAVFGPPKYSIIPELVPKKQIPKANGLITSFTYLGIIIGTFLASALTQLTNRNFPLLAGVCVLFALIGFISSLFLPKLSAKESQETINPFFLYEIYQNLKIAARTPYLLPAIFGSASFLFIGAYFQLNIIPFAMESLKMSEVSGGYLFLLTAIGIAVGAYLAGKLCKHRVELGLSCFTGILLSLLLFLTGSCPKPLSLVIAILLFLGAAGGLYVVPFDSFIQTFSPEKKRGQIVAATNFLSFCGVLLAPLLLYLFHGVFNLMAATGFQITAGIILIFALLITAPLSKFFLDYMKQLIRPIRELIKKDR